MTQQRAMRLSVWPADPTWRWIRVIPGAEKCAGNLLLAPHLLVGVRHIVLVALATLLVGGQVHLLDARGERLKLRATYELVEDTLLAGGHPGGRCSSHWRLLPRAPRCRTLLPLSYLRLLSLLWSRLSRRSCPRSRGGA